MRLSEGRLVGESNVGVAIKFLRSKMRSANLLLWKTREGRPGLLVSNFSTMMGTNTDGSWGVTNFGTKLVVNKFLESFENQTGWPGKDGISDMAKYTEDGLPVNITSVKTPFYVMIQPSTDFSAFDNKPGVSWLEVLITNLRGDGCLKGCTGRQVGDAFINSQGNPIAVPIFRVLAVAEPGAEPEEIGTITLVDDFFRSTWGDEHLKFQHDNFNDDLDLNPQWKEQFKRWNKHLGLPPEIHPLFRNEQMEQWPVMRLFQPCAALATLGIVVVFVVGVTVAALGGRQPLGNNTRRSESSSVWNAVERSVRQLTGSNKCRIVSSSVGERGLEAHLQCDTAMDAGRSIITLEQSGSVLQTMVISQLQAEAYSGSIPDGVNVAIESIHEAGNMYSTSGDDDSMLTLAVLAGVAVGLVLLVGLVVAAALMYMSRSQRKEEVPNDGDSANPSQVSTIEMNPAHLPPGIVAGADIGSVE